MRRWSIGLVGVGVFVLGCSGLKDRFSARSGTAAEVGPNTLTAEEVASVLKRSGGGPSLQAAQFVSNLWLDYALFAQAVAEKSLKTDSATVARVMWPEVAQARIRLFHDSVAAARAPLASGAVDSAYQSPDLRVFQHIIVIPKGPTAGDTAAAEREIAAAANRIRRGTSFGQVASEVSADGSRQDQGYLPAGGRGKFVKEFEDPAWALEPGATSGVVKSPFGFHLIRRPPLDEARERIQAFLQQGQSGRQDSAFVAQLARSAELKVAGGASAAIRAAAADPQGSQSSKRTLVSMKGGDLTVGEMTRWLSMFPPNARIQLQQANDSLLGEYARALAQNVLLLREADRAKVDLKPDQWKFVELKYSQSIESLRQAMGLTVPELSDSSKLSTEQRSTLAAQKVEDYFQRLLSGQAQMQMVLPELANELRSSGNGRVNQAGVSRALELAMAEFRRDSAAAATRATPAPGIQRAPGGPPIGGESRTDSAEASR